MTTLKDAGERLLRLLPYGLLLALIAVASLLAGQHVSRSPYFHIHHIDIHGAESMTREEVLQGAGLQEGIHALGIDPAQVRLDLIAHPWVVDARIRVKLPDHLTIHIQEQRPQALLVMESLFFINASGHIFARATDRPELWDLPVITGLDRHLFSHRPEQAQQALKEALSLIREFGRTSLKEEPGLSEVHLDPVLGFELITMKGAIRVRLGREDFGPKLARLETVLADLQRRGEVAEAVFLDNDREPQRVVVKLSPPSDDIQFANKSGIALKKPPVPRS